MFNTVVGELSCVMSIAPPGPVTETKPAIVLPLEPMAAKVAPLLTVTPVVPASDPPASLIVPWLMLVVPLYVFEPLSVKVPVPILVRLPKPGVPGAPLKTPE